MPGKVNPVIPEAVAQAALTVIGNDQVIAAACSSGNLELNQFMPLIAHKLLESLSLLNNVSQLFTKKCILGIQANEETCKKHVENSTACVTALIPKIGYKKASDIVDMVKKQQVSVRKAVILSGYLSESEYEELITPEAVCRLGN